jgi:hypothetical protein
MWFKVLLTALRNLCIFGTIVASVVATPNMFDQSFLRQGCEKTKILSFVGEIDVVCGRARPGNHILVCVGHGCADVVKRVLFL